MRCWLLPMLLFAAPGVTGAQPDPVAADACAAKLEPDAKAIYVEAEPSVRKGKDMRAVLTRIMMPKVMHGALTRTTAEPLAESASQCLALVQ